MISSILCRGIYRQGTAAAGRSWPLSHELSVRRISSSSSSSSSLSACWPWLMVDGGNNVFYNFYSLADKQTIGLSKKSWEGDDGALVGSSHGWLAFYKWRCSQRRRHSGFDLFLSNPLFDQGQHQYQHDYQDGYINLPPVETLPIPLDKLGLGWGKPRKIILSCSPKEHTCRAIMSFGPDQRLAYCCPGQSDQWTPIGGGSVIDYENEPIVNEIYGNYNFPWVYEDFLYSMEKKQLLCTTICDSFESWDLQDPLKPKLNWKKGRDDMEFDVPTRPDREVTIRQMFCHSWKYLVLAERSNRLFLVRRHLTEHLSPVDGSFDESNDIHPYKTVDFDVHELIVDDDDIAKKGKLRYMDDTLDGMSFFIGSTGHGFAVERDTGEMIDNNVEPDSIYFTDTKELTPQDYYWNRPTTTQKYGGHDVGIFSYQDKSFSHCYYPCDIKNARRIEPTPTWFTPSL